MAIDPPDKDTTTGKASNISRVSGLSSVPMHVRNTHNNAKAWRQINQLLDRQRGRWTSFSSRQLIQTIWGDHFRIRDQSLSVIYPMRWTRRVTSNFLKIGIGNLVEHATNAEILVQPTFIASVAILWAFSMSLMALPNMILC
jgi:hypothetical protein